jgi:hypothetical protein
MRGNMSIPSTGLSKDGPLVVSPRRARHMLDTGNTHLYELLAAGELDSFLDGRSRKITVESIYRYISRRLAATSAAQPRHRGAAANANASRTRKLAAKLDRPNERAFHVPGGKETT